VVEERVQITGEIYQAKKGQAELEVATLTDSKRKLYLEAPLAVIPYNKNNFVEMEMLAPFGQIADSELNLIDSDDTEVVQAKPAIDHLNDMELNRDMR